MDDTAPGPAADGWTCRAFPKRVRRPEVNAWMNAAFDEMKARGGTWCRWTRVNGDEEDEIWLEAWATQPDQAPPFDADALDPDLRIQVQV